MSNQLNAEAGAASSSTQGGGSSTAEASSPVGSWLSIVIDNNDVHPWSWVEYPRWSGNKVAIDIKLSWFPSEEKATIFRNTFVNPEGDRLDYANLCNYLCSGYPVRVHEVENP